MDLVTLKRILKLRLKKLLQKGRKECYCLKTSVSLHPMTSH
ncbi:unnamed protein product [Heterosigma akashiwo]